MNRKDKEAIQEHYFYLLPKLFEEFNQSLPDYDRRFGGFFCLLGVWQPETPILIQQVGEQPEEKRINSFGFCQEKAQRLARNPDHCSSWQSRNVALRHYGGAIRCGEYIISFSGLPELGDEAMMLLSLQPERWIATSVKDLPTPAYLQRIAGISGSHMYLSPKAWPPLPA
ncbi:MAG: hypothetical protein KBB55_03305 [Candidatus Buchananbacteria bacterium]|nr:hypothetical protein [Candidatus Buchananbacteria bacterium]